jgi:hypothetical protein
MALVAAAASIGLERSHPSTVHPTCASGTAFRPAPQPMSSAILAPACHSASATRIKVALGAERAKPAIVPGSLHDEPASGSSLAKGSLRFIIRQSCRRRTHRQSHDHLPPAGQSIAYAASIGLPSLFPGCWRPLAIMCSVLSVIVFAVFWDGQQRLLFDESVLDALLSLHVLAGAIVFRTAFAR